MSTIRAPELVGQIVVVIGGSSGIGLETARRARAEGAEVVLAARNPERLERAALEVGPRSTAAFDATDARALQQYFEDLDTPDVAALAIHLMSNTAVTGATYDIDGGQQFVG